jgi:hypothetical protein
MEKVWTMLGSHLAQSWCGRWGLVGGSHAVRSSRWAPVRVGQAARQGERAAVTEWWHIDLAVKMARCDGVPRWWWRSCSSSIEGGNNEGRSDWPGTKKEVQRRIDGASANSSQPTWTKGQGGARRPRAQANCEGTSAGGIDKVTGSIFYSGTVAEEWGCHSAARWRYQRGWVGTRRRGERGRRPWPAQQQWPRAATGGVEHGITREGGSGTGGGWRG